MKLVDLFKQLKNKIKAKFGKQKLLEAPKETEDDILNNPKVKEIVTKMPSNLSQIEQAYYIYLNLGKLFNENAKFIFSNREYKEKHYDNQINEDYEGICKGINDAYARVLQSIGIEAETVEKYPGKSLTHADAILKINGKTYIANLISDLGRIKTSRRVNRFCYDLARSTGVIPIDIDNQTYLQRLEEKYGKIDCVPREEVEELDKKFGYSFFVPKVQTKDERGLYTEDVIETLKKEIDNPEMFKKYVLHGEDVPRKDWLKYKLDFIFQNVHQYTDFNTEPRYLENIRYYIDLTNKILSKEEEKRIYPYVITAKSDFKNIISIIKVKGEDENNPSENFYYMYSKDEKQYVRRTPKEVKEYLDGFDKDSLKVVGTFDKYSPREMEELEL